jgi:hypothetical protein
MPGMPKAESHARRLWLAWRPRFRLIFAYPRYWHWVLVQLERFDVWFSRRIEHRRFRKLLLALVFVPFAAVRFLGLVAICEITIIAFAASLYLVGGEWLALLLLFPFVLLARLCHALTWPLSARTDHRRWVTRVRGWTASRQALAVAHDALAARRDPPATTWREVASRSRFWI